MLRLPKGVEVLVANDDSVRVVRDGDEIDPNADKILKVQASTASPLGQVSSAPPVVPWGQIAVALLCYHYAGVWGLLLFAVVRAWGLAIWKNTQRELNSVPRSAPSSKVFAAQPVTDTPGDSTT